MKFFSSNLDFFGFSASLICAIHCVLIPVFFALGAFKGLAWLENPIVEWSLIILTMFIASLSLIRAYLYHHKNSEPLIIAAIGFLLLIVSHEFEAIWLHFITALGGILIAVAHYLNWKKLHFSKKPREIQLKPLPKKKTLIILALVLYLLSLKQICVHDTPLPSTRKEMLDLVWQK